MKTPDSFPQEVKSGSVIVKIYCVENRKAKAVYQEFRVAYYGDDGRRKQEYFKDYATAYKRAKSVGSTITSGNARSLTLGADERLVYLRAMQAIEALGIPLDVVAGEYARLRGILGDVQPEVAARAYVKSHGNLTPATTSEVIDSMLAHKQDKVGDRQMKDLRSRLGIKLRKFCGSVPVASLGTPEVETFLESVGARGRTRKNYLIALGGFFRFAQRRGFYPKDVDPLDGVERGGDIGGEIEIFSPEEMARLLAVAPRELVPYVALAGFAGLRQSELRRLDWSRVKDDHVEVTAQDSKTRSRRLVPMSDNLRAWLAPYRKTSGPVCPLASVWNNLPKLAAATATDELPAVQWKHNGLRHSFVSYRMSILQNEHQTALESGNTPRMIFQHYRQLVTQADAQRWFAITPPDHAKNVVPMPVAAAS